MDVFSYRNRVIGDYASYVRSFIHIRDPEIAAHVDGRLAGGELWPEPRIALNPAFAEGAWVDDLVDRGLLHRECARIFRRKSRADDPGERLRLHRHQVEAIEAAATGGNYVLTTGTGSGKSLAYIVPIVDRVLRTPTEPGIRTIIVYPMNALANSQAIELEKFLHYGYPNGRGPVRFARYTGQESQEQREAIVADPPQILLTNYVMLELMLTRTRIDRELVRHAHDLRFLVFDELHTYRGRQGADVALLARRTREACAAARLQLVGTSATLATEGTHEERRRRVAEVATQLFGLPVQPEHVIGETLRRVTEPADEGDPAFVEALRTRVAPGQAAPPTGTAFVDDPLSRWIEGTFGVRVDAEGRLVRAIPQPVRGDDGVGARLAHLTGLPRRRCEEVIEAQLLEGQRVAQAATGAPVFAFRLHQFVSRGDTVYATLEPAGVRDIRLDKQEFVPGSARGRRLFPLRFCRACGQEYYYVRKDDGGLAGIPELNAEEVEEGERDGYVFLDGRDEGVWPDDEAAQLERCPDDWKESRAHGEVLKPAKRDRRPAPIFVRPDGTLGTGGRMAWFIPAPFSFCLRCGVFYDPRARSDFKKLGTLGSEGRSTATTTLSLSAVRRLRTETEIAGTVRKLLCFTDNRQDAALQSGHLNDFVEITLIRSALYRAAQAAGANGLSHDELTQRLDEALGLDPSDFAVNPEARFGARHEARSTLRDVLGYGVYRDLQRGWRLTSPNLEQCGLLRIDYLSLDEICRADDHWRARTRSEWLLGAGPATRHRVCKVLLDTLRRNLAVRVSYLERDFQERLKQRSEQYLTAPWALDPEERFEVAPVCLPRSKAPGDSGYGFYLSPRGGFGRFLRRATTFPEAAHPPSVQESTLILTDLLRALDEELVDRVPAYQRGEAGHQLRASAMRWFAGDGTRLELDPVAVPEAPAEPAVPNPFFVDLYRAGAADRPRIVAREHTAQVDKDDRRQRETSFREGRLPILYCSPTMELGVDIADLHVVGLRNVPPTPANYAQRSGRAGRSGQAALVFTYCSAGSPHDQYFFRRPHLMVSGQVAPPRIELANFDLLRAHLHALWLQEVAVDLGHSLVDVIAVSAPISSGSPLAEREGRGSLHDVRFMPAIQAALDDRRARRRARERAAAVIEPLGGQLGLSESWGPDWIDRVFDGIDESLRQACCRWLQMYRAYSEQREQQHAIAGDHSRAAEEVQLARRLRAEAEDHLRLLRAEGDAGEQSDFNSYRYLASEGFLPGYNFPRLPLSAFLPGERGARGRALSRPRFLAISEFGPQNLIYHEGNRYKVDRILFPARETPAADPESALPTSSAKVCAGCGYLHPARANESWDTCDHCGAQLPVEMRQLLRLQNVVTKRSYRITSDEEERRRMGYELRSAVRFEVVNGRLHRQVAVITIDGEPALRLSYGGAATLWRMNLRWKKHRTDDQLGFWLDVERGRWASARRVAEEGADPDRPGIRRARVVPYVEDRKNSLILEPLIPHHDGETRLAWLASLAAAIKSAIQIEFQLEDSELAAEILPSRDAARAILLYEAAEGGAGVLRRLVDDPATTRRVARVAVELCHVDPDTGIEAPAVRGRPVCEQACYDCLMSYANQPDHVRLDRRLILPFLRALLHANGESTPDSHVAHLQRLENLTGSELEREFLRLLHRGGHRLPDRANHLLERAGTRPDFLYERELVAVYIDGPHHQHPERAACDRRQETALEDAGYSVIRFAEHDDWQAIVDHNAWVFGAGGR